MFSSLSWPVAVWLFIAATALHNPPEAIWLLDPLERAGA
ncbi:hypothetical protein MJC1_02465 [Methylocystis sp. MJC1]|nr:hypothetical protein MJC1_02465 [Methylocystis sp. MJC1]